MIWSLIGSIGGKVLDIVDDVVEDKDEANRLKFEIQRQLIENKSNELESAAKIVLAEAQGSWLQRNWRPLLISSSTLVLEAKRNTKFSVARRGSPSRITCNGLLRKDPIKLSKVFLLEDDCWKFVP